MRRRAYIIGTGAFVILMMIAITPMSVQAAVVWSDNFDDGNFDGWITDNPADFTCSNGYLESTDYNNSISHENDVTLGTYSFDFYVIDERDDSVYFNGLRFCFWQDESMSFNIDFEPLVVTYYRFVRWPGEVRGTWTSPVDLRETWNHIDITIQDPFVVDIFINGTHVIHDEYAFPPTTPNEGVALMVGTIGEGIDNIVVSDTIDVECQNATCELDHYGETTTTPTATPTTSEPTTTTPPPTEIPMELLALGIGVPVVIIVVIVVMRMKRS